MKPPFSYYGGKQRIVSRIIPHIPHHAVYAEPFCGGATVLFAKKDLRTNSQSDYIEAINDTNSLVYNFFTVLRDRFDELNHLVGHSLYSQEEHGKACAYSGDDPLWRAYYFYLNISQSFANQLNGGWGTSLIGKSGAESYKNRNGRLKACADRLQKVHIANEDALRFIDRWDSPQTFFYCDPPYPNTNQGHYGGYTQADFERLLLKLDGCEGSFILSCYSNDAVPKEWKRIDIKAVTSSGNVRNGGHRDERTECIWIREAKEPPRKEILKIYQKQIELKLF